MRNSPAALARKLTLRVPAFHRMINRHRIFRS
jgi:hypothetical protein